MNRFHRPPGLPMLAVTLLVAWFAVAELLDASAPIAEPAPTF